MSKIYFYIHKNCYYR